MKTALVPKAKAAVISVVASSAVKHSSERIEQKLGDTELLFRSAQQMGLEPIWITPKGLFVISCNGQERYVNFTRSPLNSHTSMSLTLNKHLTRLVLERHQMPNIPFTRPASLEAAEAFLATHQKIIVKPATGSGARDIHIVTTPIQLQALKITKYILEKYITGQEIRYLVLNGEVIGVHRSEYEGSVQADRPLKRISFANAEWDPTLVASAIKVARILDLKFAAVDYLITPEGDAYILEVNSTPGIKWFHAPTSGPVVDVARKFLEAAFGPGDTGTTA